ncbi:hypothetical protein M426DRAFT_323903 [Hypoxylon sp. CI-4A]|nr:hypothetical protein M426DRAFT_323903 [Hypoxylon sp. CI-4A]
MHANQTLIYKQYTPYTPVPGEHLAVESRPFDPEANPPAGGLTVKNLYLSFDPYQRGQIRPLTDAATYAPPWIEGEPAVVTTLATVLKSDNPRFKPGDLVTTWVDAGEYAVVGPEMTAMARSFPPLSPSSKVPASALIGALGVAGLGSYISFFEFIKEPRAGKTMWISAASGGVGQIVGQLGKMYGMKVIGSTGSDEKVDFVKELGFDGAWNYKTETTDAALKRLAPEGLDIYYDNVGGEQFETALNHMKDFGIIVSSGMVSQYSLPFEEKYGIKSCMNIFLKRLTIYGFIAIDKQWMEKYLPTFAPDMTKWLEEGKIKTREEVVVGMANAPKAFIQMLEGDKIGKMVLKIEES